MVFAIHSSATDSEQYSHGGRLSRRLWTLSGAFWLCLILVTSGRAQSLEAISREVSLFNIGQPSAGLEAISRELSLFNLGEATATSEAISRELSLFNLGEATAGGEAISRELSLFNRGEPTAEVEAISRELSVLNLGSNALSLEAISREVSLFNLGEPTAALEAISREVSVFMNTNPLPDLTVSLLDAPSAALGGESVAVSFVITNRGPFTAEGPWTNHFLLAASVAGDVARLIGTAGLTNSIGAGDFLVVTQVITLPLDAYGNVFLGVRVDGDGNVSESEENNNEAFRAISLTYPPLPDLVAAILEVTNIAAAGQPVHVTWGMSNAGPAIANAPWQEKLLLADNPAGSNAAPLLTWGVSNALAPGSILQHTQSVILPAGLAGNFWFVVQADSASQVFEGFGETNNLFVSPQPITITAPDLQVVSLTAPGTAVVGQSFVVNWGVTNAGNGAAQVAWIDRVWFSSVSNSISGATLLTSVAADVSPLALAGSYTTNAQITIPLSAQSQAGSFWLIVQTDATGAQPESNENNNLRSVPITLALPPLPDLVVGNLVSPANALPGQSVLLNWAVTNTGSLSVTGAWSETVFLATNSSGAGAFELGTFRFTNQLAVGVSLERTQSVTLPVASPLGDTWFMVRVDSQAEFFETTETNNLALATNATAIPAVLTLELSGAQVSEGSPQPLQAVLTRNGSRAQPLSVTIINSDPTELSAPTNVVIAAGQASVSFSVFGLADSVVDGPQSVQLQAQAAGFASALAFVTVLDSDLPKLTLTFDTNLVIEGGSVIATVARDAGTNAVAVQIVASSASQLSVPASVMIPAGSNSVGLTITAVDDTLVEAVAEYSLSLSASGHVPAGGLLSIQDNDFPLVTIDVAADSVSEGDGPQATLATITRSFVGARPLVVALQSSDTNALLVPAQVTIPAGALAVSVPLAAVDNALVNPTRKVDVLGYVQPTGLNTVLAEAVSDSLFVTDDDGPSLKVTLAGDLVAEGLNPATTGTVTRNTGTNGVLVVNLSSSDLTEITVPASVTIPAGASSATFNLVTPADGTNDGNQLVTVTASAPGYTNGNALLTVSDINLPDLIVRTVTAPTGAETEAFVNLGYQLLNQGLSTMASNTILQRIYLSSDPLVGNDLLMGQFSFSGGLPPGDQVGQTFQLRLPQAAGDYWVVVETDAGEVVPEILENNNLAISASPIHVAAAYGAVVSTSLTTAPAGTPVPLTGHATNSVGGPAAFVLVNLHIKVRGTHRIISALTDDQGNFTTTWQPLANEAGFYEIAAGHPGETDPATQDTFTLLGMKANPEAPALTVVEHGTNTGLIEVRNLSDVPLTGLTVAVQSQPANIQATVALFPLPGGEGGPATNLLGLATNYLRYVISAQDTSLPQGTVLVRITSAQGATLDIPLAVTVKSLVPRLVSDPAELVTGMKRGAQRLVNFSVANVGGGASGPISVSLPDVPWMNVVNPNPLSSLAPGQSNTITLQLTPPADLQLTTFEGALALNATNAGLTVPFKFRALSEAKGDLKITAVDEYTYYAEGSPKVTNATVVLKDALSGELIVTNGLTDANGEFVVTNLMEGYYALEVSADFHTRFRTTRLIGAGQTNDVEVFLSRQTVQYHWTVVPTEINDSYEIRIESTFEANVPAPVVTMEPALIDLRQLQFVNGEASLELNIENHGLVAANDLVLELPRRPGYRFSTLVETIGVLPALTSLKIPLKVTDTSYRPSAGTTINGFITFDANAGGSRRTVFAQNVVTKGVYAATISPDARFQLVGLSPGQYAFSISGYGIIGSIPETVMITDIQTTETVVLIPAKSELGSITGSVAVAKNGQAVAGAQIQAIFGGTNVLQVSTVSDSMGRFALNGLPLGDYQLVAEAAGFARQVISSLSISNTVPYVVQVGMESAASVTIVVADETGQPFAGKLFAFAQRNSETGAFSAFSATSSSNVIVLEGLSGGDYDVEVEADGYLPFHTNGLALVASQAATQSIALHCAGSITGTIDPKNLLLTNSVVVTLSSNTIPVATLIAEPSGEFLFESLPPGVYDVMATSGTNLYSPSRSCQVLPCQITALTPLPLQAFSRIVGIAHGKSSTPLGSAEIHLLSAVGDVLDQTVTDHQGRFMFPGISNGVFYVKVLQQALSEAARVEVINPGTDSQTELYITNAHVLGGTAQSSGGTPLTNRPIHLLKDDSIVATTFSDAYGSFVFLVRQPGTFDVWMEGDGECASADNVMVSGSNAPSVMLMPGITSHNIVLDSTNVLPAEISIWLRKGQDWLLAAKTSSSNGNCAVRGLSSGLVMVDVNSQVSGRHTRQLVTLSPAELEVHINLPETGYCQGDLMDESGASLSNRLIVLESKEVAGIRFQTFSDENGRYATERIPVGKYFVSVQVGGGTRPAGILNILAGENNESIQIEPISFSVLGRITDLDGIGLPNAFVETTGSADETMLISVTDDAGYFELSLAHATNLVIRVTRDGFATVVTNITSAVNVGFNVALSAVSVTDRSWPLAARPDPRRLRERGGNYVHRDSLLPSPGEVVAELLDQLEPGFYDKMYGDIQSPDHVRLPQNDAGGCPECVAAYEEALIFVKLQDVALEKAKESQKIVQTDYDDTVKEMGTLLGAFGSVPLSALKAAKILGELGPIVEQGFDAPCWEDVADAIQKAEERMGDYPEIAEHFSTGSGLFAALNGVAGFVLTVLQDVTQATYVLLHCSTAVVTDGGLKSWHKLFESLEEVLKVFEDIQKYSSTIDKLKKTLARAEVDVAQFKKDKQAYLEALALAKEAVASLHECQSGFCDSPQPCTELSLPWSVNCGGRTVYYQTLTVLLPACQEFFDASLPAGDGTLANPYMVAPSYDSGSCSLAGPRNGRLPAGKPGMGRRGEADGLCATVRLQISQSAAGTRDAFSAKLEIINDGGSEITDIDVYLLLTNPDGAPATDLFGIYPPVIAGLEGGPPNLILPSGSTGSLQWIIVPTVDAAPTMPVQYAVSGTLSYVLDGISVIIPLSPVPIAVFPNAQLTVRYFHQRDVFSNDPFTDAVEPSIPYSLAVMVQNKGYGVAKNFHITSAQPQIVDNEKGLLADFKIIATEVAGQNLTPSLTADFGTINPGAIAIGRWLMTSTIQGLFIDYKATFEHLDGLGNKKLSLIDEVSIHEMIHLVQAGGSFADGKPDFLVNDLPDLNDYPDTLYLSDGTTNRVELVTSGVAGGTLSPGNLTIPFTAPLPGGWAYLRVPDPADGQYRLKSIVRSDGTNILADNFWTTDRTFIGLGRRPIRENVLHLLDYNSTGSYTLEYELNPALDVEPPSSSVAALPADCRAQFPVTWSGNDNSGGSGVSFFDVYVSENGGAFRRWLWETIDTSAVYQGNFGRTYAFYSVAVDRAGNREAAPATPDAFTTVTLTNHAPVLGPLNDVTMAEGQTLLLNLTASDPDEDGLIFSLVGNPPAGLFMNPYSGLLTWATGEAHGPSTNPVTVQVLDSGAPRLGVTRSFTIFVTDDNAPPVLAPIANRTIAEGFLLTITNTAQDFDLPAQELTFSLGLGAPTNASINKTTGWFTWRPTELQGGTTNRIAVIVSDDGVPSASATQSFTVIVRDTQPDFTLSLGTTQLLAGAAGRIPLRLHSGTDLTNVQLVLAVHSDRLTNLNLQALAPEVAAADFQALGSNRFNATFRSRSDAALQGDLALAQLAFATVTNGPSSVARLTGESLRGDRASSAVPLSGGTAEGRVFVIAREPILDGVLATNRQLALALYGLPGKRYALERRAALGTTNAWTLVEVVNPTTLKTESSPLPATSPAEFFRIYELPESGLSLRTENGQAILEWPRECAGCELQETDQLGALAGWQASLVTPQLVGDQYRVTLPVATAPRYYRLLVPVR